MKKYHQYLLLTLTALILFSGGFYYWLKQPYQFPIQRKMADEFITLITDNKLDEAYEMTTKDYFTGKTFDEFKNKAFYIADKNDYNLIDIRTLQSNGNRLRRLFKGVEIEPSDIIVANPFKGYFPFYVRICHTKDKEWKICRFEHTAG